MDALKVTFELTTLHCTDEADGPGDAEPYLWTAFFKVDGDSVVFDPSTKRLKGQATVIGTPGDLGNLGVTGMGAGQTVNVPATIGRFETWLQPIRTAGSDEANHGGFVGCLVFLREEDATFVPTVELGHATLNSSLRHQLDTLIPTLGNGHQQLNAADETQLVTFVALAVLQTMENNTGWDTEFGDSVFGNGEDDTLGMAAFHFSQSDLEPALQKSIAFERTFRGEGQWTLRGKVSVGRRDYDAVWRPGTGAERVRFRMQFGEFESEYNQQDDRRIHLFNTYHEGGRRRYDAVWRHGTDPERHGFGLRLDDFRDKYDDLRKKDFRIHLFNTYEEAGHRHYDALWRPGTTAERFALAQTTSEFLDRYEDMKKDHNLHLVNTYIEEGTRRYDAIWRPGAAHEHFVFGKSRDEFVDKYEDLFANGYRLRLFNTYVEDGHVRYDATWRRGEGGETTLLALGGSGYMEQYDAIRDHMRIELLNTYHVDA